MTDEQKLIAITKLLDAAIDALKRGSVGHAIVPLVNARFFANSLAEDRLVPLTTGE